MQGDYTSKSLIRERVGTLDSYGKPLGKSLPFIFEEISELMGGGKISLQWKGTKYFIFLPLPINLLK